MIYLVNNAPQKYQFFDESYVNTVDTDRSVAVNDDLVDDITEIESNKQSKSDIEEGTDNISGIEGGMNYSAILNDKDGKHLAKIHLTDNRSGKGQNFISIEFMKDPGHYIYSSADLDTGQFTRIEYFDVNKNLSTIFHYENDKSKSSSTYPDISSIERKNLSGYLSGYIGYTVVDFVGNKQVSEKKFTRPSPYYNPHTFDRHPDFSEAEHAAVDPIVFDLDGDGVKTLSLVEKRHFDLDNSGFAEQTAWVDSGDGLLVRDLDGNGRIESGAELFGDHTALADGTRAADGYEALAQYDDNGDGLIDAKDPIWQQLNIWQDSDSDAQSTAEELHALAAGNRISDRGTVRRTEGFPHSTEKTIAFPVNEPYICFR